MSTQVERLMQSVHELGNSCAKLSDRHEGAEATLRKAASRLRESRDALDIADSLEAAGLSWQAMQTSTMSAAVEAHRFAQTQL